MIIILYLIIALAFAEIKNGMYINDTYRIFHGINILDSLNLTEQDCQSLNKNGFNLIRLGIFFDKAIPTRPKSQESIEFNSTYFEQIRSTTRLAASFDIHIILVAHQRLLNQQFCGYGFPDWAVQKSSFPYPSKNNFNKSNKYPIKEECIDMDEYLKTEDVGANFENLYTNQYNLTDYFGLFWQQVAKLLKDEDNVLGYDILNDPTPGNYQRNYYETIWPGWGNRKFIMPFYRSINTYIRSIEKNKIIFYQSQMNDFVRSGFDDNVGGDLFRNKEAFSYKLNCVNDFSEQFCTYENYFTHWLNYMIGKHARVASILAEFSSQNDKIIDSILNQADYFLSSWIYKGSLQKLPNSLIRPYATKICATEVFESEFDSQFNVYKLSYHPKLGCSSQIFIPFSYDYQCSGCSLKSKEDNSYYLEIKPTTQSKTITLIISKKLKNE